MINLIPPDGKKAVVREYWVRIASVWGLLLSGACISMGLMLIPAYVLTNIQLEALQGEIQERSDAEDDYARAEAAVKEANVVIGQLSLEAPKARITEIVRSVAGAAGADVRLQRFEISGEQIKATGKFQIQGVATTRESLAAFKEGLERHPLFETVVLPISDLAHVADLPFAVSVTISSTYR